ncbi:MAG: anaerobic ribonucleoside-triphosphate reductase activating protein [Promethearchaeota archaeon]
MNIGGIIDISTKDIPNKAAMVIFTKGCNFNCEFCHNKYLLKNNIGKKIKIKELIKLVNKNSLVNSLSITGGEPTLQEDLIDFCKEIKKLGKYISIDTNGSKPEVIQQLIPFINRIALDIKAPLKQNNLKRVVRQKISPTFILNTFLMLNKIKTIAFEIRTTYVENLLKPIDIHEIIAFLKEHSFSSNYVLQQYQYSEGVGEKFKNKFHMPSHLNLLNILKPYKDQHLPFDIYIRDDIVGYRNLIELIK